METLKFIDMLCNYTGEFNKTKKALEENNELREWDKIFYTSYGFCRHPTYDYKHYDLYTGIFSQVFKRFAWDIIEYLKQMTEQIDYGCTCNGSGKRCCSSCRSSIGHLDIIPANMNKISEIAALFDIKDGFWRKETGCQLPRKYRSTLCLSYRCFGFKTKRETLLYSIVGNPNKNYMGVNLPLFDAYLKWTQQAKIEEWENNYDKRDDFWLKKSEVFVLVDEMIEFLLAEGERLKLVLFKKHWDKKVEGFSDVEIFMPTRYNHC